MTLDVNLEDAATVGLRAAEAPPAAVLEGAEERPCEECGEAVVLNPATQHEIAAGRYPETIMCLPCVAADEDGGSA